MRTSLLSVIALASLLILAGCAGLPSTGEDRPSPDAFPSASEINSPVLDRHATELTNTSFTLETETTRKKRLPNYREENFTYMNSSFQFLVEPGASQYLARGDGYYFGNGTVYSDGAQGYARAANDSRTSVTEGPGLPVFNESSDQYLWGTWFSNESGNLAVPASDATYQREGIETFQGVPVMRYEATGVDALPDWFGGDDVDSYFEEFSATLLLDENGVIRYYEYEFVWTDYHTRRHVETHTVSDVGNTTVQKPDWVTNATPEP